MLSKSKTVLEESGEDKKHKKSLMSKLGLKKDKSAVKSEKKKDDK